MVPYPLFQAEQFTFCFDGAGHGLRHSHGNKLNRHNCKKKGACLKGELFLFRLVKVREI
jgi:hypothetical protein